MAWTLLAQSDSIETLGDDVIEDMELPKGTRVRVTMDLILPVGYFFNLPGAEYIFRPFMPEGVELIDVHSNGAWGAIVEGVVDPAWLLAVLGFIKVHWLAISLITIGITFALSELIKSIRFNGDVPSLAANIATIVKWGAIGAVGVAGIKLLSDLSRRQT